MMTRERKMNQKKKNKILYSLVPVYMNELTKAV
jgi:hypothetical protein